MASFLREHPQFSDTDGEPLVNGKIYIGSKGNAPKTNLITIFSDRELTIPLDNPQTINPFGQSTNKMWIPGEYSMQVDNSNDVQKFQDLDAGKTAQSGITTLSNVQDTNTITAEAATTISAYVEPEIYIFKLANTPTGAVTLNIDSVGAKAIVKHGGEAITDSDGSANDIWAVAYNSTNDNFELQSDTSNVVDFYQGTSVASAATTDIWAIDGNTIHITGSTGPITSFGTSPNVGAIRWVIFDSTPTLTQSANLNIAGGSITVEAGDAARVYADTTTQFDVTIFKADGTSVSQKIVQVVNTSDSVLATGTGIIPFDNTIPQITEGTEFMTRTITPTNASNLLLIQIQALTTISSGDPIFALFQDAVTDALAASGASGDSADPVFVSLSHFMNAGTVSEITFRFRIGGKSAATLTFNGSAGTAVFGGVSASLMTITEISA